MHEPEVSVLIISKMINAVFVVKCKDLKLRMRISEGEDGK